MSRVTQKQQERSYVEDFLRCEFPYWEIQRESETPDFIINDGQTSFGLEVTTLHKDIGKRGSAGRKKEDRNKRRIASLQKSYEERGGSPLSVRVLGNLSAPGFDLVEMLKPENFPTRPVGHHVKKIIDGVTVFATKAVVSHGQYVKDAVGFVRRDAVAIIEEAIDKKARRLEEYKARAGGDVRLLLVSDHLTNSGKLLSPDMTSIAHRGFTAVYFHAYPGSTTRSRS